MDVETGIVAQSYNLDITVGHFTIAQPINDIKNNFHFGIDSPDRFSPHVGQSVVDPQPR
jgi:hypothetical protein